MRILVLNPGSSTLKAALVADGATVGTTVAIDWPAGDDGADAVVADAVRDIAPNAEAVGYRVVHGGTAYRSASPVDDRLLQVVEDLDVLAPLHNRRAAAVIRAGRRALPDLPHIACFDTAFHATLAEEAWRYALPPEWVDRFDIRRYGFHGLSVAWSVRRAAELLRTPSNQLCLVVAHLGSGCSVTAVDGGRSVDTSMGYTPYEGLMMGTRSGSIDPGILLRLADDGLGTHEIADGLAHRSGLAAVVGTSDVREVETRVREGDERARLAVGMFARRAAAGIAAMMTTLPRVDALGFTGGIGEHSAVMRSEITRRLAPLGIPLADGAVDGDGVLLAGPPAVLVVEAREDLVIAEEVVAALSA